MLDKFWDLVAEVPTNSVLRERLEMAKEAVSALEAENVRLTAENAELKALVKRLKPADAEFVEHEGVLWKRTDGGFAKYPYCPECKVPMASFAGIAEFSCHKCDFSANFGAGDLKHAAAGLPKA